MAGVDLDDTLTSDGPQPGVVAVDGGFAVGEQIAGRYAIVRFVAAGGMGEVYEADDRVVHATVALKAVTSAHAASRAAVERLLRELALARKVTHPNVCRLHDVGEHRGRTFLTMELLDGETLAERLRRGPLPAALLDRIAEHLIAALTAAHAAGVVHRDFKSSNIILVGDPDQPRAVVTDFGLARSLTPIVDAKLTADAALLGTPAYMAPEQVEGREATEASDIYALGVVLFEMATGTLPFVEDTPLATATARLTKEPPRPRERRADLEPRWEAAILRCLRRDPSERPQRAGDVIAPRHRRRRISVLVGAGVAVAAAVSAVALRPSPTTVAVSTDVAGCATAASRLIGVWDAETRAPIAARFESGEHAFVHEAWRAHARQFDAVAAAWATRWDAACASPDRIGDPLRYGQRIACLDTRLLELRSYVHGLADPRVDVEEFAVGSPGEFPIRPVAECDRELLLRAQVPPPAAAVRAEVDELMAEFYRLRGDVRFAAHASHSGNPVDAAPLLNQIDQLRARALALGDPARAGEIGWYLAEFLVWFDRFDDSDRVVQEVIELADRHRDDRLLAQALADLVSHRAQVAPSYDVAASEATLARATSVAARLGSPPSLADVIAEASRFHAARAGSYPELVAAMTAQAEAAAASGLPSFSLWARSERARARARQGEASLAAIEARAILVEREALTGSDNALLGLDLIDLASVFARADDVEAALAATERAVAIVERIPQTRGWTWTRDARVRAFEYALALGRTTDAERHLRAAVDGELVRVGSELAAHAELAEDLRARGDRVAAEHVIARAERLGGGPDAVARLATVKDALRAESRPVVDGSPAASLARFGREREALGAHVGWSNPERSIADARFGIALVEAGRPAAAIEPLERAIWVQAECCEGRAVIAQDARFALARAVSATGGDRDRARALATEAHVALIAMGPALATKARAVEAWLAALPADRPR